MSLEQPTGNPDAVGGPMGNPDGARGPADSPDGPETVALDALVRRVRRERPAGEPAEDPGSGGLPRFGGFGGFGGGPAAVPRWVAIAAVLVAVGVGFAGWRLVARPAPIEERMPLASGGSGADASPEGGAAPGSSAGGDPATGAFGGSGAGGPGAGEPGTGARGDAELTVHVAGAVAEPGLVTLPAGSRVADAVDAAGGLGAGADPDRLNLAATLGDGSRVFIPLVGQPVPPEEAVGGGEGSAGEPSAGQPVDVNTADAATLEELPGVGPATAEAIIAHREEAGAFTSVDALLDVRGIGEAKLEALRDLVTVG